MKIELTEAVWLDERPELTLQELMEVSGLPAELLRELVEVGALSPMDLGATEWRFTSTCVTTMRSASRLRDDFDLDANALALVLRLMARIEELEAQVRDLRAGRSTR